MNEQEYYWGLKPHTHDKNSASSILYGEIMANLQTPLRARVRAREFNISIYFENTIKKAS